MPPQLALLVYLIPVFLAFRSDRKRNVVLADGLFWPSLWYMIVASRALGIWLQLWGVPIPGGGGDATDGSLIDRSFYAVLTVIGLNILARRRFNWGATFQRHPWLAALLVYMAVSILWSDYTYVSFKRYIKIIGSITMAMVVLTSDRPHEAMLTVLRRCLYIHLPMSILCTRFYREIGVAYDWSGSGSMWQGISTTKNTLGQIAMLGVLYFFWEVRLHWKKSGWRNLNFLYLLMAVYLLKGGTGAFSMTSASVCVFALIVFLRIQSLRRRPAAVRSFILLAFGGTFTLIVFVLVHSVAHFSEDSTFGHVITLLGKDITMTGRTDIWHDVYDVASRNPLFGVGFGGFWIGRIANIPWNAEMTWELGQAHSGYIDIYLHLGLVGVVLMTGVIFSTIARLLKALHEDFDFACFRITLLATILFINVTESSFLRGDHHLWFVMMLCLWFIPTSSTLSDGAGSWQDPVRQPLGAEEPEPETAPPEPAAGQERF